MNAKNTEKKLTVLDKYIRFGSSYPYNTTIAKMLGSDSAHVMGVILKRYLFHEEKNELGEGGWFYLTIEKMYQVSEGLLTEEKQNNGLAPLLDIGVVEKERRGIPAKRFFRINMEMFNRLLTDRELQEKLIAMPKKQSRTKANKQSRSRPKSEASCTSNTGTGCGVTQEQGAELDTQKKNLPTEGFSSEEFPNKDLQTNQHKPVRLRDMEHLAPIFNAANIDDDAKEFLAKFAHTDLYLHNKKKFGEFVSNLSVFVDNLNIFKSLGAKMELFRSVLNSYADQTVKKSLKGLLETICRATLVRWGYMQDTGQAQKEQPAPPTTRKEMEPEWLEEYSYTPSEETSIDLEEERRRLEEEMKMYCKEPTGLDKSIAENEQWKNGYRLKYGGIAI